MIEKVQNSDGTVVEFDLLKTISTLSERLQVKGGVEEQRAQEIAKNIIEFVSERFVSSVPSAQDFENLVNLVLDAQIPRAEEQPQQNLQSEELETEENITPEVESQEATIEPTIVLQKDLQHLQDNDIHVSEQASKILEESTVFNELGRSIFLDRYAVKGKRDTVERGDLVVALTKEDRKFPVKDLGIVKSLVNDRVTLHMITGQYANEDNKFEFSTTILKCDKPVESIKDAHKRIAGAIASVEQTPELQEKWTKEFLHQLQSKHIQPAGRIMTGASVGDDAYTKNLTLFNCYVIPSPKDSRDGIIKDTLFQMCEIMSRGGGVGINLSSLRPRYAYVKGVHGKSSGSVSWGGIFSYATALIEQGGSRRGALMLMMHDWHPDILEFINAKRKKGVIENANISVLVSDSFMKAVEEDGDWNLEFPDYEQEDIKKYYNDKWDGRLESWKEKGLPTKIFKTIRAREMWDQIINSAWASAEPGIVFYERYNKMSNSYYFNPIICTNPCGEQGLPAWGVCNLGHLYLASFLKQTGSDEEGPLFEINWTEMKKSAQVLTRFLDNVIDKTPYHFVENEKNQKSERRIGGGTLGLGEMLVRLRLKYGSPESIELIDQIYKTISIEMYKTSALLATEKGAFPKFEAEQFLRSGFMQQLPEVHDIIRENGIRNVTLTTQAPTGTVGTMLATTTGIEPYYAFEYYRQSRMGFHKVRIPLAIDYASEDGALPDYFITAMQMSPMDHIKVQAAVQQWTDSSISKTANAPESFTVDETRELYEQAYKLGCKGVTIYRDNSRYEQVLSTDESTGEKNAQSSAGTSQEISSDVEEIMTNVVEPEQAVTNEVPEEQEPVTNVVEQEATYVREAPESSPEEEEEAGKSCVLKIDAYGQTYKSCSE